MDSKKMTFVMIPEEEWVALVSSQQDILTLIKELHSKGPSGVQTRYVTAKEFMEAVRIKRTKFDQLVQGNRIRIIKKRRKIYVPINEIERFFSDPDIQ